jgi:hypothetical protein
MQVGIRSVLRQPDPSESPIQRLRTGFILPDHLQKRPAYTPTNTQEIMSCLKASRLSQELYDPEMMPCGRPAAYLAISPGVVIQTVSILG